MQYEHDHEIDSRQPKIKAAASSTTSCLMIEHNRKKYVCAIYFCNKWQELEIHLLQQEASLYTTHPHKT